mmetsp:Transcript_85456/g.204798  ORF Transcript_85456/g.204798 Transcript_85456/m.204798 type:complete len:476 (+) Transcript_85456:24-1451(+)
MAVTLACKATRISLIQQGRPSRGSGINNVALNLSVEVPLSEFADLVAALKHAEADPSKARSCSPRRRRSPSPEGREKLRMGPFAGCAELAGDFPTHDPFEQMDMEDATLESPIASPTSFAAEAPSPVDELEDEQEAGEALLPYQAEATLRSHSSWVNGVAWSPDSERIVTGSAEHTACVWKASNVVPSHWKAVKTLRAGSKDGFRALAWSPDCSRLVAAGMDKDARVYLVSGSEYRTWEANGILCGHTDILRAVSWSPCGRKVLTGGDDKTARIWKASRTDPLRWEQFAVLPGHSDSVRAVAWRPDKARVVVAAGLADSTIVLWRASSAPHDRRAFEVFATLSGHTGGIRSLDWAHDGTMLASGSKDATARIWHCDRWKELATLRAHSPAGVQAVAWSPDSTRLATAGADAILRVWTSSSRDPTKWEEPPVEFKGHLSAIRSLCWSPDGAKIITGSADRTARIWRAIGAPGGLTS